MANNNGNYGEVHTRTWGPMLFVAAPCRDYGNEVETIAVALRASALSFSLSPDIPNVSPPLFREKLDGRPNEEFDAVNDRKQNGGSGIQKPSGLLLIFLFLFYASFFLVRSHSILSATYLSIFSVEYLCEKLTKIFFSFKNDEN